MIASLSRRAAAAIISVLALLATSATPPVAAAGFTTVFINAGGGAYTDTLGNAWSADNSFSGGGTYSTGAAIAGTADQTLYQTERTGQGGAAFAYAIPAPDGTYTVTLKFAEIYWTSPGQRVFSVTMNGLPLLTNFDILMETAPNSALDKSFVVNVTGGTINLTFTSTKDNAKVAALEVAAGGTPLGAPTVTSVTPSTGSFNGGTSITIAGTNFASGAVVTVGGKRASAANVASPTSLTATTPAGAVGPADVVVINRDEQRATLAAGYTYAQIFNPIRVNAGGGAYTDTSGNAWSADTGFSGGGTFSTGSSISGTADPTLYETERTGQNGSSFSYAFTVPNATYTVTLKFAEIFLTTSGSRLFNVVLNGQTVLSNFDMLTQTAPKTALDKTYQVSVTTGAINIAFNSVKDNAKVSAIQIVSGANTALAPSITSVAPTSGSTAGGTALTISGTHFANGPMITVGGAPVAAITSFSSTSIGVNAPAHVAGAADVVVTNGDGQSATSAGGYTYVAPPFSFIRVNAGGGAYTDTSGNAWSADTGFSGGGTYSTTATIAGTSDPTLYQTERTAQNSGSFAYVFALPNGTYAVTLKFAEIYWTSSGQRLFNVSLNGQQLLTKFDILTQTAPKTALDKTYVVKVTTGAINLSFTSIKDNAKVSAIQILNGTDSAPAVTSIAPANGQIGVPTSSAFSIGFSEPMDRPSTQAAFSMSPALTGSFSWNSDGTLMTFVPSPALNTSTTYSATIVTGATDLAGTALGGATAWSFTTGTQATPSYFAWSTNAPSPIRRLEAQGIGVNGKLYVFGGYFNSAIQATVRSDVYDPATDTWTRIADTPEPLTHAAVVNTGLTIWLIGGLVGDFPGASTAHVWKYDIPSNTWSAGPSLPADRGAGAAVVLGTDIHFFGGAVRPPGCTCMNDHADHWIWSLNGGTAWTSLASIPNARNHLAGAVLGGRIYAIGGQHNRNEASGQQSEVDIYDPATNSWSQVAPLPSGRGHINSSTIVTDNRIFVLGGSVAGGSNGFPSADVIAYDPQTNIWLKLTSLPGARKSPVVDIFNGKFVVTTGNSSPTGGVTATSTTWSGNLTNVWESGAAAPVSLGDVSAGVVGNTMYVVGQGSGATLAYNLTTSTWSGSALAARPFAGNQHGAEAIGGKLYLIGGLTSGQGMVQIYDPAANSWSLGANMSYAGASVATSVIGGQIYAAGGIVGSVTTTQAARYDPVANTWTSIASMPVGVNYAAAATDGRKLYVFGGRGGSVTSNGFNYVQIYDPATGTWVSSTDPASTIAPLPQGRGGMGKAVYFNGEFYVIGGETLNGAGATGNLVYSRVDIYNPVTNTWRQGASVPTPRHGIYPVQIAGRIYVAAGGVLNGTSSSNVLEIYDAVLNTPTSVPAVFKVTPSAGSRSGGTVVTITGTNLNGATAVRFGGVAVTSFTVNSANWITVTAPAFGSIATVDVTVTSSAGTSTPNAVDQFGYGP